MPRVSWEDKFWVFDAHMHPISSVYRRGGTIGEPNADPRFTLSLAEQGGLGAAFFNTSIDEFLEVNHIAVKDALMQIDRFYSEIAKYPDQVGVATNLARGSVPSQAGQDCGDSGHRRSTGPRK